MSSLSVKDVLARYYQQKGLSAEEVTREPSFQKLQLDQQAALMKQYGGTFHGRPSLRSSMFDGLPTLGVGLALTHGTYRRLVDRALGHEDHVIANTFKVAGPVAVLGTKLFLNYQDYKQRQKANNALLGSSTSPDHRVAMNILGAGEFSPHGTDPMDIMTNVGAFLSGQVDEHEHLSDAIARALEKSHGQGA